MLAIFGISTSSSFLLLPPQFGRHPPEYRYSILLSERGFGDPNSEIGMFITDFMENMEDNHRTFKRGSSMGLEAA